MKLLLACLGLISCGYSQDAKQGEMSSSGQSMQNVTLKLTDAPTDLSAVNVVIKEVEMRVARGGKEARLIVAQGLGQINLLDLRNGVTMPMGTVQVPAGTEITQIRLILEAEGNHTIDNAGTRCDLRIPSQTRTGVKMLIHGGVTIENGYDYSLTADFDAEKSVVALGNGGCLLKPVLKLKSASRVEVTTPSDDDNQVDPGDSEPQYPDATPDPDVVNDPDVIPDPDLAGEQLPVEGDNSSDPSGFDSNNDPNAPPILDPDDLSEYWNL